jgi:CheY-like chemotaxis protein
MAKRSLANEPSESDPTEMSQHETDVFPSVLVVSASDEHRVLLANLLSNDGYEVTLSASAPDALLRVQSQHFDLVVTGILMFQMDGLELLRAIVETVPNLPVIVVGDADPKMNPVYLKCASLLGASETYNYPPEPETFLAGARGAIGVGRIPHNVPRS